jgi:hypothetical protein
MMLGDNVFYAVRFYVYCTLYIKLRFLHMHERTIFDARTWTLRYISPHHCSLEGHGSRNPELTFLRGPVRILTAVNDGNDEGRMDVVVCVYFK